jgi:hypothetical protein
MSKENVNILSLNITGRTMETKTIQKNGASPKSLTCRDNLKTMKS